MGVTKITKIYYQHNTEQGRWNYNIGTEETLNGGNCKQITRLGGAFAGVTPDRMQLYFKFRNKANNADIEVEGSPIKVFGAIASDHAIDATSAWAEGVLPFVVHASVADAKTAIMHPDIIAAFNSDTDRNEFELVDGDKGLKHTRDHKINPNAGQDSHSVQLKAAITAAWDGGSGNGSNDGWLNAGCILTDSDSHIF